MKPIQIVGGGLAGLSLGIALRQGGAPVAITEAGSYPRHRVCGEFISGQGRAVLRQLGLEEKLRARGAREAVTAAFYGARTDMPPRPLPEPALCLSRFDLDQCLADEFRQLGGVLTENTRWREPWGDGIVRATGRSPAKSTAGWRWFGLKVHARGVPLAADLEMHLQPDGYVGLCRLDAQTVNVCGLFRTRAAIPHLARNWRQWLEGPANSILRRRLADAQYDESSFCSTAGLNLAAQRAADHAECRIGDAITMISPMTGNGMSMAFEAAGLAAKQLFDYSAGRLAWPEAAARTARAIDVQFRRRLAWGARLQNAAFRPRWGEALLRLAGRSPFLWRHMFQRTR
ncbi:MAG TPA: FAD-dependent monooxygenase [Verrucomicrobiae bacterium]|nr:FAD-dependent monooxygenase [Verrucomicrobiae bacterium]